MATKGSLAKEEVTKKIAEAFGQNFLGEYEKKLYILANENGEQIQIAISLTCPKNPIPFGQGQGQGQEEEKKLLDIDVGGAFGSIATPPKRVTEITEEEKRNLEALMKRLNL